MKLSIYQAFIESKPEVPPAHRAWCALLDLAATDPFEGHRVAKFVGTVVVAVQFPVQPTERSVIYQGAQQLLNYWLVAGSCVAATSEHGLAAG